MKNGGNIWIFSWVHKRCLAPFIRNGRHFRENYEDTKAIATRGELIIDKRNMGILFMNESSKAEFGKAKNLLKFDGGDFKNVNEHEQQKKVNLGKMIMELKELVPGILEESLPKRLVDDKIVFRICPTYLKENNGYFPLVKGAIAYYSTCRVLQLLVSCFILTPKVKIHVQSIRVLASGNAGAPSLQGVFPESNKIYMRWSTCSEECEHLLVEDKSSNASENMKKETHSSYSNLEPRGSSELGHTKGKALLFGNLNRSLISQNKTSSPSLSVTLSHLLRSLIGLKRERKKLERIISGVFIFDLSEDNERLIAHTIENIDIIEKKEMQNANGELKIC